MKKITALFFVIILFSISAFAQKTPGSADETRKISADYKSDGCSLFPDCDFRDCCVEHDKVYYFGGTSKERWRADKKLYKCVRAKKGFHHKIIAPMMWVGVRIGGVSWLPTPFRWGFGKNRAKKLQRKKCLSSAKAKAVCKKDN